MASLAEIEADVKNRVDAARAHLAQFVDDHLAGLHKALGDLGEAASAVASSPVVAEVESFLPTEVSSALKLVESFLVDGAKALTAAAPTQTPPPPAAPEQPVSTPPAG